MGTNSNSKKRPKDLLPPASPFGLQSEWRDLIEDFSKESDRGVAMLAAAYVDTALKTLVESKLAGGKAIVDKLVNDPGAPLGSLSSRSAMAFALGAIGPNYFETINAIREIRNAFAHFRRSLTFEDLEIKQVIATRFKTPYILPAPAPDLSAMRNRFIWTTAMVLGFISGAQLDVKPLELPIGG